MMVKTVGAFFDNCIECFQSAKFYLHNEIINVRTVEVAGFHMRDIHVL